MTANPQAIREYFLETSGRAERGRPNPLFAGRDEAIQSILRSVERLSRSTGPMESLSTVLYGAPGSGKSEMLAQLRERLGAFETDLPIAIVSGGADVLTESASFGAAVYEQLDAAAKRRLRNTFKWDITNLTLGPIGLTADRKDDRPLPSSERTRMRKVAMDINTGARHPIIVLLIDEAQAKLRTAFQSRRGNHVLAFHEGDFGLKVLPIYAGLGNTLDALRECDVSRLGDGMRHPLRRLPDPELGGMAEEALTALTGRPDAVRRWADKMVEYAQGWPMHLSHGLRAVASRSSPGWTLNESGFRNAMRDAERKREQYYGDRLYACPQLQPEMFAPWATLFENEAVATQAEVSGALRLSRKDGGALVKQAVGAGLLEEVEPGRYASPIPSLIDHIEGQGRTFAGRKTRGRGGR